MSEFVAGSPAYVIELENLKLQNQYLKNRLKQQAYSNRSFGGVTVQKYIGSTASPWVPIQGQLTYGTIFQPIASGQNFDYLTDINVWSRGTVSTAGVITANTTSIIVRSTGSHPFELAPGESITLRRKNPNLVEFAAGATPAATDVVEFIW